MATARITLVKSLSFDGNGRTFRKGESLITDNASEISYYKSHPEFTVSILREVAPPAPTPSKTPKGRAVTPKAVVVEEVEEDEDDGEDADADVAPEDHHHTLESLAPLSKGELIAIGTSEPLNLALTSELKKSELIKAILEAQA